MKTKQLRQMQPKELDEKLLEMKKELLKVRGQIAVGTAMKNPGLSRTLRRTIAKILSIKSNPAPKKAEEKQHKTGGQLKTKA